jgi:hypothetical protein
LRRPVQRRASARISQQPWLPGLDDETIEAAV